MWGNFCTDSVITAHCDNIAVVQVVENSRTRDPLLAACIRNIWLLTAKWDIQLKVVHILGKENTWVYTLSRLFSSIAIDQGLLNELQANYTWDVVPIQFFYLGPSNLISGGNTASAHVLASACEKINTAYKTSTSTEHTTHFKKYLADITFMDLPLQINIHNVLTFIE